MKFNIISRFCLGAFLAIFVIDLISYISHIYPAFNAVFFIIIAVFTFILSLWKIEYGLYLILAELFVGGLGHLFEFRGIPIRMALFCAVLLAWIIIRIRNHELGISSIKAIPDSLFLILYSCLLGVILLGIIIGLMNNDISNVYADANAWLYFLLLPVFLVGTKKPEFAGRILELLISATSYLAFKTALVFILFSRGLAIMHGQLYDWLANTGVGEVTPMGGAMFRVFFQSHFYCLAGLLIALGAILLKADFGKRINFYLAGGYIYLMSLVLVISQSRSMWIGAGCSVLFLLMLALFKYKIRIKSFVLTMILLAVMVGSQFVIIQLVSGGSLGNRFGDLTTEAAGASRLNQLQPLSDGIIQSPFFGHGFGKTLTYISKDPRVFLHSATGEFTTYAFEWGYLDLILKFGMIGTGVYLTLILLLFVRQIQNSNVKGQNDSLKFKSINVGFAAGLIGLCAINMFTPYLNHPLGMGYILLCLGFSMHNNYPT